MNSRLVIGYYDGRKFRGWCRHPENQEFTLIVALYDIKLNYEISFHERSDLKSLPGFTTIGFEVHIEGNIPIDFFYKFIKIQGKSNAEVFDADILPAIEAAGTIDAIDISRFSEAWTMLSAEKKAFFANSAKNHFKPWQSARKKRIGCVLTYANSANAWFPYFYNYYTKIFGDGSIYVISPNIENFSEFNLGGSISLSSFEFSDSARAQLMSNIGSGLGAYYENVIICDVDEILLPNPKRFNSFSELLEFGNEFDTIYDIGIDVLEIESEGRFDFQLDVLSQRSIGILNSAMSKPFIYKGSINFCAGGHFCDKPINLFPESPILFNLHLKFACSTIRKELTSINSSLSFESDRVKEYCVKSNAIEHHPQYMKSKAKPPISIDSQIVYEFLKNYEGNASQCPHTGHFSSNYSSLQYLIKLDSLIN